MLGRCIMQQKRRNIVANATGANQSHALPNSRTAGQHI
jgi:hypothetical protein